MHRKDSRKWPTFIYRIGDDDSELPIGLALRSSAGEEMRQEDVSIVKVSEADLNPIRGDHEELISHTISISIHKETLKQTPFIVSLAVVGIRPSPFRQIKIKTFKSDSWLEEDAREVNLESAKDVRFVEFMCRSLDGTVVAAVTRQTVETCNASAPDNLTFYSDVDARINFTFKEQHIRRPLTFTLELNPVDLMTIQDTKRRRADACKFLLASSSVFRFKGMTKPCLIRIPIPPNPSKLKRPVTGIERPPQIIDRQTPVARNRPKTAPKYTFKMVTKSTEEDTADALSLVIKDDADPLDAWRVLAGAVFKDAARNDAVLLQLDRSVNGRMLILRHQAKATVHEVEVMALEVERCLKNKQCCWLLKQKDDEPQRCIVQCIPVHKLDRNIRRLAELGFNLGPPVSDEYEMREGQEMLIKFRGNVTSDDKDPIRLTFNSALRMSKVIQVEVADKFAQRAQDCFKGFIQIFTKSSPKPKMKLKSFASAASTTTEEIGMGDDGAPLLRKRISANQIHAPETRPTSQYSAIFETRRTYGNYELLCDMLVSIPKPPPEPIKPIITPIPFVFAPEGLVDMSVLEYIAERIGNDWSRLMELLGMRRIRIQAILRNNCMQPPEKAVHEMLLSWLKRMPRSANKTELLRQALGSCGREDIQQHLVHLEEQRRKKLPMYSKEATMQRAISTIVRHSHLLGDWKALCQLLDIADDQVARIEAAHADKADKSKRALLSWQEGGSGSIESLISYLRRSKSNQLADIVDEEYRR